MQASYIDPSLSNQSTDYVMRNNPEMFNSIYSNEYNKRLNNKRNPRIQSKIDYLVGVNATLFNDGNVDPDWKVHLDTLEDSEIEDMYREAYQQIGDKVSVKAPEVPGKTMRETVGKGIDNLKTTARNLGEGVKVGGGKFGKGLAIGGALVSGTALAGTVGYNFLNADGKEFVQDILPGESENARLAIERQRLREEADREWNRMRPFLLTPQEQMVMGREQAQWAAKNRLEYQSLAGLRDAQIKVMANRVSNQLAAMQVTNDTVANILNQRL